MSDFEAEWRESWRRRPRRRSAEDWSRRAASAKWRSSDSDYPDQVLAVLAPEPDWTVLDVGCGTGTLAVPLARRVRAVTAIDFADGMLAGLRERCAREGLANVVSRRAGWEDDWDALGIGAHDLAVASRSLVVEDLGAGLRRLDRAARKLACVVAPVGDGPHDRRVFEAVGRAFVPRADYRVVHGRLGELGIRADVDVITRHDRSRHASPAEAAEALSWMLTDPSTAEMDALRRWLRSALVETADGWVLAQPREVRWAVIVWRKDAGGRDPGGP